MTRGLGRSRRASAWAVATAVDDGDNATEGGGIIVDSGNDSIAAAGITDDDAAAPIPPDAVDIVVDGGVNLCS
jgi:hypothetical protein